MTAKKSIDNRVIHTADGQGPGETPASLRAK